MAQRRSGVATRGIGFELERHRKAARMTLQQVADRLGVSISTISRLENGKREATSEEVASILAIIGVTGDVRERLLSQARGGNGHGLLVAPLSAQSRTYWDFEQRASKIINFEPLLVPGLAQTADYSRAVISALQFLESESEIESRVANRLARQALLTRRQPPELCLIINEAALRQLIGGPDVMARQIRHLIELAERPGIAVHIIPSDVVTHPGLSGSFVIMTFEDSPTMAYVESRTSGMFLDDPAAVHFHQQTADMLLAVSLDAASSVVLMRSIAEGSSG